jgi:hypothetical protein
VAGDSLSLLGKITTDLIDGGQVRWRRCGYLLSLETYQAADNFPYPDNIIQSRILANRGQSHKKARSKSSNGGSGFSASAGAGQTFMARLGPPPKIKIGCRDGPACQSLMAHT